MADIFVDTDIVLDLLADRVPFSKYSEILFELADNKKIKILATKNRINKIFINNMSEEDLIGVIVFFFILN